MNRSTLIRLTCAALCAAGQAVPAAAQRAVVEIVPVNLTGPSAAVGAVSAAMPGAPAPTLAAPTPGLLAQPAALAAVPTAAPAVAPIAAPAARSLAAPASPAAKAGRLAVGSHRTRVGAALPKNADVGRMSPGAAHGAGVAVEDAITGRRSGPRADSSESVGGFWRFLVPSGLARARGASARAAEPERPAVAASRRPAEASEELQARVEAGAQLVAKVRSEVGKVIVGQREMIDALLIGLISGEHILLEGVPGVAKTATVKAFADATEAQFQRIQGTPDKLPSDILGAEILQEDPQTGIKVLKLEQGPIVTHILLVDEINRMMPKTQAALLEAMQERRITIGRTTINLPEPFIVLATQNPIEQEGTYRLPEAQQDRFMLKVIVDRPTREQLKEVMLRFASREKSPKASKVTTLEEFAAAGKLAQEVYVGPEIQDWITHIVEATNDPEAYGLDLKKVIENGASPRAAIYLYKAAQARAFLEGRSWVDRSDIFAMAPMILRHRLILSYEANKITVDEVVQQILKSHTVWRPGVAVKAQAGPAGAKPN